MAQKQLTNGEIIGILRERAGISLADLAKATALSIGLLSLLENDKREVPTETLKRIYDSLLKAIDAKEEKEKRIIASLKRGVPEEAQAASARFIEMTVGARKRE